MKILHKLKVLWKTFTTRDVPADYFPNDVISRRLAMSEEAIDHSLAEAKARNEDTPCWVCKHAEAYISWQCSRLRKDLPCEFERCYSKENITKLDLISHSGTLSVGGWCDIPPLMEKAPQ